MKKERTTQRPAWHSTNGFKIGAGIAGIIILAAIIISLNGIISPGTTGSCTANSTADSADATGAGDTGTATLQDGVQVLRMAVDGERYVPSTLTVQAGKPVKWIVDGTRLSGCAGTLVSPQLGISRRLVSGDNIIEFTPAQKGTFGFSCSMGMVRGTMNVV